MEKSLTCYSIGHSNHTMEFFLSLIASHGITLVADVRSVPFSRFAAQFNRKPAESALRLAGVEYEYLGDMLGGKNSGPETVSGELFQRGLETVISRISGGANLAIMCAEKDPLKCHRFLLISPELSKRGVRINHILADGSVIGNDELLQTVPLPKKKG